MNKKIDVNNLSQQYPLIKELQNLNYVFWANPKKQQSQPQSNALSMAMVYDAEARLKRFSSYIKEVYPITRISDGIIDSDVKEIEAMKKLIEGRRGLTIPGKLMLKCDHSLPVAGSIKARGGIYEVLTYAEKLAISHGLLTEQDDYAKLHDESFRNFFRQYKIAVGSTGNLGLSIGIISAQLGFQVTVHMSADAKRWKKALLRKKGVEVIEYDSDYSEAVAVWAGTGSSGFDVSFCRR